jgi:acylphosphatase
MQKTISITVSGKVQGVNYRASARDIARELGLLGYVKNLPDGNVYLVATGEEEPLQKLVKWCHRGPAPARVMAVNTTDMPLQSFDTFDILR